LECDGSGNISYENTTLWHHETPNQSATIKKQRQTLPLCEWNEMKKLDITIAWVLFALDLGEVV
jgi:hypothetical protein